MVVFDPTSHPLRPGRSLTSHAGHGPQHLHKGGVLSAREGRGEAAAGRMHGRHQCFPWHLLWLPSCLASCSTAVPRSLLFLSLAPKYGDPSALSWRPLLFSVVSAQSWGLNATYVLATLQTSPLSFSARHLTAKLTILLSCLRSIANMICPKQNFLFPPKPAPPQAFPC